MLRILTASVVCATAVLTVGPAPAMADDSSTVTVVGTSDVFDSDLVQTVIKPGFEAAYPQYHLNYVSKGTGAAIAYAEAGTASAMIVHAASLENQYVAAGYSSEPYGRAIFWGDYVLLGPANDPAGVMTDAPHDIVKAFQDIATAGAAGNANFVSRGGTPGTTVQEHAIWALTQGVQTCAVSAPNGGGTSPSTTTGACPTTISYPGWYQATGLTQGPNVTAGDTCPFAGGGCYVFTDRGTFNYLQSTNAIHNLKIVTRDNAPTSTGGRDLLINSFHAYGVNPAKFSSGVASQINAAGASAFLNWITSPAAQTAVGNYLNGSKDAPFIPSAAPKLTASALPKIATGATPLTVTGNLSNVIPGTPALAGKTVKLNVLKTFEARKYNVTTPTVVATTTTDAAGNYTFVFKPTAAGTYSVSTDRITQVENGSLSPIFSDLLAPTSTSLGTVNLFGKVSVPKLRASGGSVSVNVGLAPAPSGSIANVQVYAALPGHAYKLIAVKNVKYGQTNITVKTHLERGHKWNIKVVYRSSLGQFATYQSPVRAVLV